MKSFAATLLVAIVSAQYQDYYDSPVNETSYSNSTYVEDEDDSFKIEDMFELNEEGRWELSGPHDARVSFEPADQERVEEWTLEQESKEAEIKEDWDRVFNDLVVGISDPWNQFISGASQV